MKIRPPSTMHEYAEYYEKRWALLRKPWSEPRGSEKDNLEQESYHVIAIEESNIIGGGRIHFNSASEAQVRYMFVLPEHQGRGIGKEILSALESYALSQKAKVIKLNSRENAIPFYERQGYQVSGESPKLFGIIAHKRMQKSIWVK
ncbi:MAG: GNAT family N-acetyltransferase [Nanoarchaeota archaeon]|nr:GNAT family N-acetyltransferase [Nanoarchaeota archaeon]